MDVVEPMEIAPQPIRDAIDYYQIVRKLPIEPDRAAFSKAGLNLDVECQCDVKEMTLREQLRWLSGVIPQPIRLIEKNGELRLTPASSSKSGK